MESDFKDKNAMSLCMRNSAIMGTMPYSSGTFISAAGSDASSAISSVMIRSNGCRSLSCRLPVSRITANISRYNIIARRNSTTKVDTSRTVDFD